MKKRKAGWHQSRSHGTLLELSGKVAHFAIVLCKSSSLGFPSYPIEGGLSSSYLRFNGEKTTWEFLWNKKCLRLKVRWSTENFLGYGGGVMQVFLSRQDAFPLLSPYLLLDKRDFLQLASSFRFKQGLLQHHFATLEDIALPFQWRKRSGKLTQFEVLTYSVKYFMSDSCGVVSQI